MGIELPLTVLLDAPTPRLLAERAANPGGFSATSSLVRFGKNSATRKLYLIHGAGGNVIGFRELATLLADEVDVIGVQAAGVEPGQQPDRSMAAMVARYATAIEADDPVGPYWIGGYSDGGLISLHLAQEIRQRGSSVSGLVILDSFVADVEQRPSSITLVWVPGGRSTVFAHADARLVADEIRRSLLREPTGQ